MAINVFFFSDESMHKIFLNYGKYNFIQQIPQIIYTTIISQLIEVFLGYLGLTDKYIYQIKKKAHYINKDEIIKILKQKISEIEKVYNESLDINNKILKIFSNYYLMKNAYSSYL
jgi:hypothetical protein